MFLDGIKERAQSLLYGRGRKRNENREFVISDDVEAEAIRELPCDGSLLGSANREKEGKRPLREQWVYGP